MMIMVYITCPDSEEAQKISRELVERRLVACANILPQMQSVYRWEGTVETGDEIAVIFKTRAELFDQVKEAIVELHSFECPCIVALPIEKGHAPFLEWIEAETQQKVL